MAQDVKYLISLQDKFSGKMKTVNQSTKRLDKNMGSVIGRFASFAVVGAAVGAVLSSSVKKMADFEEQASNLSAITGLVGDDLDYLKGKAIEMGGATTKSSIDTIKAFKLIASAKPELLGNADALAAVTKEAITLSEASGLELPEAAKALTSTLNQFGLSADQASRAINVMAAGSKFAAAEIPDLSNSLMEFGGVADSLNITLEESAAAVETLSTKGLKGQRAGMMLRNVFLKLGAATDKNLNPKIVGLGTALKNLAPIQDDVSELTKMFGRQNVIAAQTLIKQRLRVDELTESLTGTSIAYEQAAINTDNLNSDVKFLNSSWEKFVLNLNEGNGVITETFRNATQAATKLLDNLDMLNKTSEERAIAQMSKDMANLKKELVGVSDVELIRSQTLDELIKADKLLKSYKEDANELGEKRVEKSGSLVRNFLSGTFINKEKEQSRIVTKERINSLIEYKKSLEAIMKSGDFSKLITAPASIIEPEKVDGLDKVEDQVTRITAAAPKTFNINIGKFVENFTVQSDTITESAPEVREFFEDELLKMLADAQAVS